ncbi:hypothetical protein [Scatolibacter rhodanostii]|uniref:hypothetical protein n=1 Tax=Scatolibacter rhodanostii TaxID=2014781 RepID=UPI000C073C87|nr:hypothetical protein [Scatolibacter rhodanostii]
MEDIKEKVLDGYEKLAFGDVSDPIRLLFQEKVTSAALRRMNLFNIAQIKKKDSEVDIKFFDRIKALQCMQELERGESGASDFLTAVQQAAETMQDDDE